MLYNKVINTQLFMIITSLSFTHFSLHAVQFGHLCFVVFMLFLLFITICNIIFSPYALRLVPIFFTRFNRKEMWFKLYCSNLKGCLDTTFMEIVKTDWKNKYKWFSWVFRQHVGGFLEYFQKSFTYIIFLQLICFSKFCDIQIRSFLACSAWRHTYRQACCKKHT